MAELDGAPEPALFKQALRKFEEALLELRNVDARLAELEAIDASNDKKRDPAFEKSLVAILKGIGPFERAGAVGLRYSNAGGVAKKPPAVTPTNLATILGSQREDLRVLIDQLQDTIDALRGAIPTAEKGEFAALMLSGRSGFADKILQSVNLIGAFTRYYTKSCLTTIDATMQSYPSSLKWLKDSTVKRP